MSPPSLVELSYGAAVRALDLQERAVDQLRARTGTLLAAASLTASFAGAQTIQHRTNLGPLGLLALVALVVSIGCCLYILLPKRGVAFSINATTIYEALFEVSDDADEQHRRLIYWLEGYWARNQTVIERLGRSFAAAAFALAIQMVLWCGTLLDTVA